MKNLLMILIAILGLGTLVSAQQSDPKLVEINISETETVAGTALKVKFAEVLEDSRCPTGAQCVWAGRVRIRIEVQKGEDEPASYEIESGKTVSAAELDCLQISLKSLTPHPSSGSPTNNSDYKATISVTKSKKSS
jgi:hypothetical protein